MRGKGTYGWFTLFGVQADNGLRVRLGRATSEHTARGIALSILRTTSRWRYIDIYARSGKRVERIIKPELTT